MHYIGKAKANKKKHAKRDRPKLWLTFLARVDLSEGNQLLSGVGKGRPPLNGLSLEAAARRPERWYSSLDAAGLTPKITV